MLDDIPYTGTLDLMLGTDFEIDLFSNSFFCQILILILILDVR